MVFRHTTDEDSAFEFVRRIVSAYIMGRPVGTRAEAEMDWPRIGQIVAVHGLEGIFAHMLKGADLPPSLGEAWHKRALSVMFGNLKMLRTAARLFAILDEAGIPSVAMRGMSLAHKDYLAPGMRTMGDVDILIRSEDCWNFLEAIGRRGIEPERVLRSQYVFYIDGTKFEIHWSFLTAKRYRDIFDSDVLLADRTSFDTQDGRIYCLSNEHELIGLITHAFIHHELTIVKQLVDIGLFMVKPEMDWAYIREWSRSAKLSRMFALTGHLTDRIFRLDAEGFYRAFGDKPSPRIEKTIPHYFACYSGRRTFATHIGMKRNLLYAAEPMMVKLKQFAGFFTKAEGLEAWQLLFGRNHSTPEADMEENR